MNVISGVIGAVLPGAQAGAASQAEPAQNETFGVAMLLALLSNQSAMPSVLPNQATADGPHGTLMQGGEGGADVTVAANTAASGLDGKPASGAPVVPNAKSGGPHESLLGQALAGPFLAYSSRAINTNRAPRVQGSQAPTPTLPTVAKANTMSPLPGQIEAAQPIAGQKQVVTTQPPSVTAGMVATTQKVVLQSGAGLQTQSMPLATVPDVSISESKVAQTGVLKITQPGSADSDLPKVSSSGVTIESLEIATRTHSGVDKPTSSPNGIVGAGSRAVEPVLPTEVQRAAAPDTVKGAEQLKTGTAPAAEQTPVPPPVGAARVAVKTSRPTTVPGTKSPQVGDGVQATDPAKIAAAGSRGVVRPTRAVSHRTANHPAATKPSPYQEPQSVAGQVKQSGRGADTDGPSNVPTNTRVHGIDGFQNPAAARATSGHERVTVTTATNGADKLGQAESTVRTDETALRSNPADRVTLKFTDDQGVEGRVRVAVRGQAVRATIVADDPAVARRLGADLGELQQALDQQGFRDAQLTVQQVRRSADLGGVAMASNARAAVDASSNASGSRGPDEQGSRDRPQQDPRDSNNSGNGRSQQRSRQRQER